MSTILTFMLFCIAAIGTLDVIYDPLPKLRNQLRGKKKIEAKAELEAIFNPDGDEGIERGCALIGTLLVGFVYLFLIEPVAIIYALVNNIGSQPVAYFMLAIVAVGWFNFFTAFEKQSKSPTILDNDEEFNVGNPIMVTLRRFFFAMPIFYLWYLFFAVITA